VITLGQLLVKQTKAALLQVGLDVAAALGLPVSSWQPGDPTRTTYHYLAEILETLEVMLADFCAAGFLDYAAGDWLILLAKQVFNVDAIPATFATCTVLLSNAGGGVYDFEPGDITFRNSSTDRTYRNTTGGHLGASGTLLLEAIADEAGSDSSAAVGEIDELVTTLLGVTCANTTAAVGQDAESPESIRSRCRAKLGALSPNGPRDAYAYVAREPSLTGTTNITRVRVFPDSDTGDVAVYVAGPAGPVSTADLAAATAAILRWATPLTITPLVANAVAVPVPLTYTLWIYRAVNRSDAEVKTAIADAFARMLATQPIGGDVVPPATTGALYRTLVESTVRGVYPADAFRVAVVAPAVDVALANNQVAVAGAVTGTIVFVDDP